MTHSSELALPTHTLTLTLTLSALTGTLGDTHPGQADLCWVLLQVINTYVSKTELLFQASWADVLMVNVKSCRKQYSFVREGCEENHIVK